MEERHLAPVAVWPRKPAGNGRAVRVLVAADVVALAFAFLLATGLATWAASAPSSPITARPLTFLALFAPLPFFALAGLYSRRSGRMSRPSVEFPRVAAALSMFGFVALEATTLKFISGAAALRASELLLFWVVGILLVPATRTIARAAWGRQMAAPRATVIVGAGRLSHSVARKLLRDPSVELLGFVDSDPVAIPEDLRHLPVLGREDNLARIVNQVGAEKLVVAFSRTSPELLVDQIRTHALHQIDIAIVPRFFDIMTSDAVLDDINGIPVIDLAAGELTRLQLGAKRVLDLALTLAMAPVLVPMIALIALAVRLDSPGPVFFRQPRRGRHEAIFNIIKFRTMRVNAESERDGLLDANERTGPLFKMTDDPRVTRVGRILRRTSLDELPQLINVLRGEMSLVGPRPFVTYEDAEITGWARRRLDLAPGLTGLWQVMSRSDVTFEEMLRLDHLYVTRWSLAGDIKILLQTIPAVLLRRNQ